MGEKPEGFFSLGRKDKSKNYPTAYRLLWGHQFFYIFYEYIATPYK